MKQEIKYIPYEKLSAHYWLIIQNQIMSHNKKRSMWKCLKSMLNSYWYRFKYNLLGIPIVWYSGKNKGTYTVLGKPPTIKQRKNMVWTKHVLKYKKMEITQC